MEDYELHVYSKGCSFLVFYTDVSLRNLILEAESEN